MSTFDEIEESADAQIGKARAAAAKVVPGRSKDDARAANTEATRAIKEAEKHIKQLELEAKGSAPSARRGQLEKIQKLKSELNSVRTSLQKANDAASRDELVGGAAKQKKIEAQTRDKLVVATEKASLGTQRLQQAQAVIAETQDIGISVIDTMQSQRETLLRATDKAKNTNDLTLTARGIIKGIQRRAITNKALLFGVCVILLAMIGVVVYFGYIKSPKGS